MRIDWDRPLQIDTNTPATLVATNGDQLNYPYIVLLHNRDGCSIVRYFNEDGKSPLGLRLENVPEPMVVAYRWARPNFGEDPVRMLISSSYYKEGTVPPDLAYNVRLEHTRVELPAKYFDK